MVFLWLFLEETSSNRTLNLQKGLLSVVMPIVKATNMYIIYMALASIYFIPKDSELFSTVKNTVPSWNWYWYNLRQTCP